MIPDGVTSIGEYAFYKCDNLTSVSLPQSLTSVGDDAFAYCNVRELHLRSPEPPEINPPFGRSDVTLYIPKGSLANYQQSPNWGSIWSRYKEIIEE